MSVKPGLILSGESLLQSHISNERSLPKIGEKKFKPTGSWLEKKQIQTALDENKQLLEEERVEKFGALAQAVWYNNKKLAEVTKKVGKYFHTMGFERDGKLFIYPEEALYLLEMNCLQLNYDGLPLSIQQAYSLLLSSPSCTLKEYRTYSHLTKQGYRLLRYTKTGMPTNYEHRIRLDQHVPNKRVFPEVDEVTLEPVPCNVSCNSITSERDDNSPVECTVVDRTGKSDPPVKSEKDSVEVSDSMKDFAKSIADMGKSLVKNEKSDGSEGLGLDSLRQKILDMLEDHFQGHISHEAMDAVSRSASKAILEHVEDVDSDKRCVTPNLSDERSSSSSSVPSPDEEDREASAEGSRNTDIRREDESKEDSVHEQVDKGSVIVETGKRRKQNEELPASDVVLEPSQKRHCLEKEEAIEKRGNEESEEASRKKDSSETRESDNQRRDEESSQKRVCPATEVAKDSSETKEPEDQRRDEESEEVSEKRGGLETGGAKDSSETKEVTDQRRGKESEDLPQKRDGLEARKKDSSETKEVADQRGNEESEDLSQKRDNLETGEASQKNSETEVETEESKTVEEVRDEEVSLSCTDVSQSQLESKTSDIECGSSRKPSNIESSSTAVTEVLSKTDNQSTEPDQKRTNGNDDSTNEVTDSEEEMECDEIPVEGGSSQETGSEKARIPLKDVKSFSFESVSSPEEEMSEILNEDMQADDDVVEIEDPNTWKNVKVEKSSQDQERGHSQKRSIPDSNGWKSFKESHSNNSPTSKSKGNDANEVDIIAVRNSKDVDIELIDISDDSCAKQTQEQVKVQPKEEIEIVDLDESDSDSSEGSDIPDVKQEKLPKQRPKLVSAFERARDARRKFIMDAFPNMINRPVCTVDVPPRHLLPPNINPVKSRYTVNRRELYAERPYHPPYHTTRRLNIPRFNNYHNNHSRQHHPRQPFRPPRNHMQAAPMPKINPAAMQAFQMITSIVLPMFGINNMGPSFMGQSQWNQGPMWQQPQRNWQNHQPWRIQQRSHHWNHNRFNNRPWHSRNTERDQQDVLDRPKRPALLVSPGPPTPAVSAPGRVSPWNDDKSSQEFRRPKRPFVVEQSDRDLLMDIEDEARWKKVKRMNEEDSSSDSESEVTITPINRTPNASHLQPILKLDQCESSSEIMASLDVIKRADSRTLIVSDQSRQLKISYNLFLPNIPFKKSSPPTPNFRLCIMSSDERVPTPGEISLVLDDVHDGVPLMLAVVDPDNISFFQYLTPNLPKQTFSS